MNLDPDRVTPITTRLKRAHGHLAAVIKMLEDGASCEDALTQLAAVNRAISRGGYALVATGLHQCVTEEGPDGVDTQKLEKLFLSLA